MKDEEKKITTEQTQTNTDEKSNKNVSDEENLSKDELDAVAGGSAGEWCRTIRQGAI